MEIYITGYVILFFVTLFEVFDNSLKNKYLKLIIFTSMLTILIVLSGSRYEVGRDFTSYLDIFKSVDSLVTGSSYSNLEPGFRLVIVFFKSLNFQSYHLFFIFSLILIGILGVGIYRVSELPFLSLFLFFLAYYIGYVFNVLRQGITMAMFIYALQDIKNRKFKKVLITSLIATTVHFTGVLIVISYFLYHFSLKKNTYLFITMFAIVYYFYSSKFYSLILFLLPSSFEGKLISYMARFPEAVSLASYLLRIVILALFLYFYESVQSKEGFKGLFNIYYFGFLVYTLLSFQSMGATRLNMFFRILEIILFPYLITSIKSKPYKFMTFIGVLAIGSFILLKDLVHPANFPFVFFWEAI